MHAIVHSADVQGRDGGALLMASLFGAFPFLVKLNADGGYQGPEFRSAMKRILASLNLEIVKRLHQAKGFVGLPLRTPRDYRFLPCSFAVGRSMTPSGIPPVVTMRHSAMRSLRASATIIVLRVPLRPSAVRARNH